MRIAFYIALGLSGAFFIKLCWSMESCQRTFVVDEQLRLTEFDKKGLDRRDEMPEFQAVPVNPGDRIEYTSASIKGSIVPIRRSELEVRRDGALPRRYSHGDARFWVLLIATGWSPMIAWVTVAGSRRLWRRRCSTPAP